MLTQNIINYLDKHDLKITDFAKRCGVKPSTISNILNGYTKSPTLDVVTKIAKAMDMSIDELTKNNKREMDEIQMIYNKMRVLEDSDRAQIYAMLNGAINATIEHKE